MLSRDPDTTGFRVSKPIDYSWGILNIFVLQSRSGLSSNVMRIKRQMAANKTKWSRFPPPRVLFSLSPLPPAITRGVFGSFTVIFSHSPSLPVLCFLMVSFLCSSFRAVRNSRVTHGYFFRSGFPRRYLSYIVGHNTEGTWRNAHLVFYPLRSKWIKRCENASIGGGAGEWITGNAMIYSLHNKQATEHSRHHASLSHRF